MKMRIALFVAAAMGAGCVASRGQDSKTAASQPIVVSIDARQTAEPVSNYVFGMFIEHIGKTMYGPLWAEMLDDRKFYFSISSKEDEAQRRRQGGGPGHTPLQKWRPVGSDEVVTMDKEKPFVGEQSPRIQLDATAPHGIRQSGLALVKGKRYVGRIWLRGTTGSKVNVALVWGTGENERQTVNIPALATSYAKYPFHFRAPADASDASIEIAGTGDGDFHIGAVSLMPAENIDGFRPDTIALLKQIKSGFWRFGGNYTSNYYWYDAIGDREARLGAISTGPAVF